MLPQPRRFVKRSGGRIPVTWKSRVTVDDPKAYTKPWSVTLKQRIVVDTDLIDEICLETSGSRNSSIAPEAAVTKLATLQPRRISLARRWIP